MAGKEQARGYGWEHQKERKRWAFSVSRGTVLCRRCGLPIEPYDLWDLGHDDRDRSLSKAPEHRKCNRQTMTHARERAERAEARANGPVGEVTLVESEASPGFFYRRDVDGGLWHPHSDSPASRPW
jgi:hypothetical protein